MESSPLRVFRACFLVSESAFRYSSTSLRSVAVTCMELLAAVDFLAVVLLLAFRREAWVTPVILAICFSCSWVRFF